MEMMTTEGRLENVKVRPDTKNRLDLLQLKAKQDGDRLTQADLIERILDDLDRLQASGPNSFTAKTERERKRMGQLMCLLRADSKDPDVRNLQDLVLRALDVWDRHGQTCA